MQFSSILLVLMCLVAIVENKPLGEKHEESDLTSLDHQARSILSFLDGGYAKDPWNVYFQSHKVDGASTHSFQSLGGGYGKDNFNAYFAGKKVDGASGHSFQSLGGGYGKDNFNVYSMGVKVHGASPHSLQYNGMTWKREW